MGAKTDVFVKLALVFFLSLLSFSIGTYVGKKYSDNQYQLAALEPQKLKSEHNSTHETAGAQGKAHDTERTVASSDSQSTHTGPTKIQISDEEIAQLAEEFVDETPKTVVQSETQSQAQLRETASNSHSATKDVSENADNSSSRSVASAHDEKKEEIQNLKPSKAAQALIQNKNPLVAEKKYIPPEKRIPTSLPKEFAQSPVGKFTLQVASFSNEADAQQTAEEYKSKGYSAFYIPATLKGKTWYRVSIGQFATQEEAVKYKSEFVKETQNSAAIIQRMSN